MRRLIYLLPMVLFLVGSLIFVEWYFSRYVHPVLAYLTRRTPAGAAAAERRLRRFPLAFWAIFLCYILLAPTLVITSAQMHAGFEPQLFDWFRIHAIALIVTIIVGLPVFIRFRFLRVLLNSFFLWCDRHHAYDAVTKTGSRRCLECDRIRHRPGYVAIYRRVA